MICFVSISCSKNEVKKDEGEMEANLIQQYQEFLSKRKDYGPVRDSILQHFEDSLYSYLKVASFDKSELKGLDSLEGVGVTSSADGKLRIVSWDYFNGGPWHIHNSVYQFNNELEFDVSFLGKKERYGWVSPETDSFYFKIFQPEQNLYLLKSWGSHGSGGEFYIFKMLRAKGNKLSDYNGFDNKPNIWFTKHRGDDVKIVYDTEKKTISYPEYKEDQETGFSKLTGEQIILSWDGEQFIKQE
ncbi:hypothetical protein [Spongiivirga citrea]|uniref:Uncharacterized protein n=1 Tax=Spongiivirga citrea TaxID=1481457 RepID=A0A6M0CSQ4_9FLAO|nr:hypothetical protein [Spongiivirga citrea]NER18527.1 hypothetical protein [Spongiivirga citrea]